MARWTEEDYKRFLAGKGQDSALQSPGRASTVPKESYAGRGLEFEKLINASNEAYFRAGVAYVHKVPTSSRIIRRDEKVVQIQVPSPVDYLGSWNGKALALEAKETHESRWSLSKIEEHQVQFLLNWEHGGGISGILINFARHCKTYWLPISEFINFTKRSVRGGRKSIALIELGDRWAVRGTARAALDYLEAIERWLD